MSETLDQWIDDLRKRRRKQRSREMGACLGHVIGFIFSMGMLAIAVATFVWMVVTAWKILPWT